MRLRFLPVVILAASVLGPVAMSTSASAARCVSGADVRQQVSTFVHSLRDDVKAPSTRDAVRAASIETVRAARGVKADTAAERTALGAEISALARQLQGATSLVERRAILAQIHALQEQKRAGRVSSRDLTVFRADIQGLKRAIVAKTDTPAEGKQVANFAHALMAQFNC
jgi:hypothetical protein